MYRISIVLIVSCISLTANAQVVPLSPLLIKDGWSEGYYYDASNKKITGILKDYIPLDRLFKEHFDYFYFKTGEAGEKQKIQASDIKSFVVGVDTFTISHSSLLPGKPFLQVLINEPIKLYASDIRHTMTVQALVPIYDRYEKSDYYYGSDPDNITVIKKRNFMAAMKILLANYPELLQKIQNRDYEYDDMESIINYYNGMKMEAARKKERTNTGQ